MKNFNIADITIKSLLSSGFALGLAILCLLSNTAKANEWNYGMQRIGIDSLSNNSVTTLMTLKVSAIANAWNNNSFDVDASYTGISYDSATHSLGYQEISKEFHLNAPAQSFDFSDSIRKRCQLSPQKMIGDMIIDGAIGFNLHW